MNEHNHHLQIQFSSNGTLEDTLEKALRLIEIQVRAEHAAEQLCKTLDGVFHAISLGMLCEDGVQRGVVPQRLRKQRESVRREAEAKLNQELQGRFGRDEDTTYFLVSDAAMIKMGYHW